MSRVTGSRPTTTLEKATRDRRLSDDQQQPTDEPGDTGDDAPDQESVLLTGDDEVWAYPELGAELIREGEGDNLEHRESDER